MGTRCLTVFQTYDEEIVVMYRQYDGYVDGHGLELAEFLAGGLMVNGLASGEERKVFNGMECLSAQVIAHFKDGPGNIYLYPAKTRGYGENYIYMVKGKIGKEPTIGIYSVSFSEPPEYTRIAEGTASEIFDRYSNDDETGE